MDIQYRMRTALVLLLLTSAITSTSKAVVSFSGKQDIAMRGYLERFNTVGCIHLYGRSPGSARILSVRPVVLYILISNRVLRTQRLPGARVWMDESDTRRCTAVYARAHRVALVSSREKRAVTTPE